MVVIRAMTIDDFEPVKAFWLAHPELGVSAEFDNRARIEMYLKRNPGLSTVATHQGEIIGTALCGHDGRRGSLFHVCVEPQYRKMGIARQMIDRCIRGLISEGIGSAFLFTHSSNSLAAAFWSHNGWEPVSGINYHFRHL